jgi:hypothetical protein
MSDHHRQLSDGFDGFAVALSLACMIHCLALPVAAAFVPVLASSVHSEWVHWLFVALAIPVSVLALRHNHHSKPKILALRTSAALGIGFLVFGALGWPSHNLETVMTVLGGLVLASVHLTNYFQAQSKIVCD